MTTPGTTPHLKSTTHTPDQPSTANPTYTPTGRSAPKVAARKGARSALRSDPHQVTGAQPDQRLPVAWLHIVAPRYSGATPTATSACACGYERRAAGQRQVLALIDAHTAHRTTCPLRNPTENRTAA